MVRPTPVHRKCWSLGCVNREEVGMTRSYEMMKYNMLDTAEWPIP